VGDGEKVRRRIVRSLYRKLVRKEFPSVEIEIRRAVGDCKTLLDVGCGSSSPIKFFSDRLFCVGVDAHGPSIEKSKKEGIHDEYCETNVLNIRNRFDDNSFDCVLALELIEHLTKVDGLNLLNMMERIAKKRVIVSTPNGYLPQSEYDGNPWQVHRSGWTLSEMRKREYKVIGIDAWRPLTRRILSMSMRSRAFWAEVADITQILVRNHPEKASRLLCIKAKKSDM
jgi:ubiquinone/menaquinone biosynthesis C-methylase UbiE